MTPVPDRTATFPVARWVALAWLAAWVPAYWIWYGPLVFLNLCDIAVILTCVGLWRGSALLLSSQALSSIVVDLAWDADLAWRALTGRHLLGGTEYMWDAQYPPWLRGLSLFHLVLPITLVWALHRVGYDRRGLPLQVAIAAVVLAVSRAFGPEQNVNFAFTDPVLGRALGPGPVHLAAMLALLALIYAATGAALRRISPPAAGQAGGGSASTA
jgi:hypothetical protein